MRYRLQAVGQQSIRYLRSGRGPLLLFLHGIGDAPEVYAPLLQLLARHYDVVAPAISGLPYLDHPPESFIQVTALTLKFCAALDLKPAVIVGHSYGATVAMHMPLSFLQQTRIIAINPAPPERGSVASLLMCASRKGGPAALGLRGKHGVRHAWHAGRAVTATFVGSPRFSYRILRDIALYKYHQRKINAKLLLGERDEFYTKADIGVLQHLGYPCKMLRKQYHDWPIYEPELAEKEILHALSTCLGLQCRLSQNRRQDLLKK